VIVGAMFTTVMFTTEVGAMFTTVHHISYGMCVSSSSYGMRVSSSSYGMRVSSSSYVYYSTDRFCVVNW
jgi:hypothetical protein